MTIAWVFPGQGSQKLGMADSLLTLPGALERFDFASELLGRDLLEISRGIQNDQNIFNDLNQTINTQPAMFVVESLLVDELLRQGRLPSLVAGHSLGEIVALYAAQVFDAKTALKLLKRRSELMANVGGGGMTAIIGFDRDRLEGLVESSEGVFIANDNSSSQVVLSGNPEALQGVVDKLDCKRAIPLQVSGAFHSPFMDDASKSFSIDLDEVTFRKPTFPVVSNSDPQPSSDPELLKKRLKQQMISGVRWRETLEAFAANDIRTVVEIGPGNVLSGLAKRSPSAFQTSQLSSAGDLGQ